MTFYVLPYGANKDDEFIALDNIDYVEDKLIELCEDLEKCGVHILEISSALLFTMHYMLAQQPNNSNAEKYHRYLFKQYNEQIKALPELEDNKAYKRG